MKLAPLAAMAAAGALTLGLGGVALAADGGGADLDAEAATVGAAAGMAQDFEAFDDCLRDQGVDLPPLPDLPDGPDEPTDEQIAELEALEADAIEIPDEAWEACESELPEDGGFGEIDDEAFAEFDQCMADAGFAEDGPIEGEGDSEAMPSEDEIDAALEDCEQHLPEGALIEGCDEGPGHEDGAEGDESTAEPEADDTEGGDDQA